VLPLATADIRLVRALHEGSRKGKSTRPIRLRTVPPLVKGALRLRRAHPARVARTRSEARKIALPASGRIMHRRAPHGYPLLREIGLSINENRCDARLCFLRLGGFLSLLCPSSPGAYTPHSPGCSRLALPTRGSGGVAGQTTAAEHHPVPSPQGYPQLWRRRQGHR
jgi:hypothetical protein